MLLRIAAPAAVMLVLSACVGGADTTAAPSTGRPPPAGPPPTAATDAVPTDGDSTTGAAAPSPGDSPAPGAATSTALPAEHLLVAGGRGVELVGLDGSIEPLTSIPASAAFDDGAGGVVFQGMVPPPEGPDRPTPAVMWLPPGGGDAVTVVPDGLASEVDLLDAGAVDGEPTAVIAVYEDGQGQPAEYEGSVQWVTVPEGDRNRIVRRNTFEGSFGQVSLAMDVVSVEINELAADLIEVYRLDGTPTTIPANPLADEICGDRPDCPQGFSVSPDGSTVAWLVVDDLLAGPADDADGVEPTGLEVSTRFGVVDVTSSHALVNPSDERSADLGRAARIVDLRTGDITEAAVEGRASLTAGDDA